MAPPALALLLATLVPIAWAGEPAVESDQGACALVCPGSAEPSRLELRACEEIHRPSAGAPGRTPLRRGTPKTESRGLAQLPDSRPPAPYWARPGTPSLRPATFSQALSPAQAAELEGRRLLSVVFAPAPPFALVRDGRATGYAVEVIEAAARRLGLALDFRPTTLAEGLLDVREGRADLVLNVVHTPERARELALGARITRVEDRLYVRADRTDIRDLAGLGAARVAVWPGFPFVAALRERAPGARLVQTRGLADALEAVSTDRADAVIMEPRVAQLVLSERGITNLVSRGPTGVTGRPWLTASLFAADARDAGLVRLLDQAVDSLGAGEIGRIYQRWIPAPDPWEHLRAAVALSPEERAFIQGHRDIVLGVDRKWLPMVFVDPDGGVSGIDPTTLDIINAVLGTRIRLELGVWADLLERARRREIDGLTSSAVHPERARDFRFTRPYTSYLRALLTRAGNPLGIHSLDDLSGKRVGYTQGNLIEEKLLAGIPGVEPVTDATPLGLANALLSGRIDAFLGTEHHRPFLAALGVHDLDVALAFEPPTELVFSIRRDWPLLVSAIDKVLLALPERDRLAIKQRYRLPEVPAGEPVLDPDEQAWLDARGRRLVYCHNPLWSPFDYQEDGEHRGIFREYLDLFASKLDLQLEPLTGRDWPEVDDLVRARRCDLVSGLVELPEREHYLAFTTPYLLLEHVLVARTGAPFVAGIRDLPGKRIAVPPRSAIESLLRARHPDQPFVTAGSPAALVEALDSGRADAVVATLEHGVELVERGLGRYQIIAKLDDDYPISVAVRDDEPLLRSILQKAVDSVTPAEHDRIRKRRTTFRVDRPMDLTLLWQVLGVLGIIGLLLGWRQFELARLNRRLIAAKEAAEDANRAKDDFLANISHEIRTPLNAVLNLAELGVQGGDAGRLRGYLLDIRAAGRSLLGVVNGVLDFSSLEAGSVAVDPGAFALSDLMERVLAVTAPLVRQDAVMISIDCPPGIPGHWLGDAEKIERILINLVSNGVKFTDRGSVVLATRIWTPSQREAAGLCFEVRDSGLGIAREDLAHLFVPFRQVDGSRARRYGGTGLGLAIVKRLTDLLGGRIEVDSEPGQGSRFRVFLPLSPAPGGDAACACDLPAGQSGAAPEREVRNLPSRDRVLVVEDDAVNRQIASELVGRLGLAVETVPDGPSALRLFEEDPGGFGVVLMDVQLPGMDGLEVTRRLRRDPRLRGLPVIAVTAHAMESERASCREAGMVDHLSKPYDPAGLTQVLARWLGRDLSWPEPETMDAACEDAAAGAAAADPVADAGPWVDRELGRFRVGGDHGLYQRLLESFCQDYSERLVELELDGTPERQRAIERIAHMLRGTGPMLGADRLGTLAAALSPAPGASATLDPVAVEALRRGLQSVLHELRADPVDPPRAEASGPGAESPTQNGDIEPVVPAQPELVLVVEDDPIAAELLRDLLGQAYQVTLATGGEAGLAAAAATTAPDLILLDVTMEGMDGYEVCRRLKASPATCDIPVIFLTGRVDARDEHLGLELGAVDYIHKPFQREVVLARVRNQIQAKRNAQALTRLSLIDSLTGLPNRRWLDAQLAECWAAQRADGGRVALAMMDVDRFKAYNDRHGHAKGDACLRRVAIALGSVCASHTGLLGRYGGEEFLWVLPGVDLAAATEAARDACDAVRSLEIPHGAEGAGAIITLSIGVAAARPADGDDAAACLVAADRMLYRAKTRGRDRVVSAGEDESSGSFGDGV